MRGLVVGIVLGLASSAVIAQRGTPTFPDAVTADPKHYAVEYENELVRVIRARYGRGEKSVMHMHPASCAVFLSNQNFRFAIPDGPSEDDSVRAGEVRCGDADVHLPENIGRNAAELILIEFKDRQRFSE